MSFFEITAILMVLTAVFSYINYRVLHMPTTIGVMFIALATAGVIASTFIVGGLELALSIPAVPERMTIITITYIIVVFSILIQGMTLGKLVNRI